LSLNLALASLGAFASLIQISRPGRSVHAEVQSCREEPQSTNPSVSEGRSRYKLLHWFANLVSRDARCHSRILMHCC